MSAHELQALLALAQDVNTPDGVRVLARILREHLETAAVASAAAGGPAGGAASSGTPGHANENEGSRPSTPALFGVEPFARVVQASNAVGLSIGQMLIPFGSDEVARRVANGINAAVDTRVAQAVAAERAEVSRLKALVSGRFGPRNVDEIKTYIVQGDRVDRIYTAQKIAALEKERDALQTEAASAWKELNVEQSKARSRKALLDERDVFRADRDRLAGEIDRLANYILEEIPGEPSQDQGAVDTAIRYLRTLRTELDRLRIESASLQEQVRLTDELEALKAKADKWDGLQAAVEAIQPDDRFKTGGFIADRPIGVAEPKSMTSGEAFAQISAVTDRSGWWAFTIAGIPLSTGCLHRQEADARISLINAAHEAAVSRAVQAEWKRLVDKTNRMTLRAEESDALLALALKVGLAECEYARFNADRFESLHLEATKERDEANDAVDKYENEINDWIDIEENLKAQLAAVTKELDEARKIADAENSRANELTVLLHAVTQERDAAENVANEQRDRAKRAELALEETSKLEREFSENLSIELEREEDESIICAAERIMGELREAKKRYSTYVASVTKKMTEVSVVRTKGQDYELYVAGHYIGARAHSHEAEDMAIELRCALALILKES